MWSLLDDPGSKLYLFSMLDKLDNSNLAYFFVGSDKLELVKEYLLKIMHGACSREGLL